MCEAPTCDVSDVTDAPDTDGASPLVVASLLVALASRRGRLDVHLSDLQADHMNLSAASWQFVVGTTIGLIGLVTGYYWYRQTKEKVDPRYVLADELVFDRNDANSDLEVSANGVQVDLLRRVHLGVYNSGARAIRKSDLAKSDPLRVKLPGDALEQAKVVQTRDACNVTASTNGDEILLAFDFLDQDDGFMLRVLYNARDEAERATFHGTIVGAGQGLQRSPFYLGEGYELEEEPEEHPGISWRGMAVGAALLLLAVFLFRAATSSSHLPDMSFGEVAIVVGCTALGTFGFGVAAFAIVATVIRKQVARSPLSLMLETLSARSKD